jgi:hypothetical protein
MKALTDHASFNLNGVQATTHVASPLLIVNGPIAAEIGMNGGCNAFGSGNRAGPPMRRASKSFATALAVALRSCHEKNSR